MRVADSRVLGALPLQDHRDVPPEERSAIKCGRIEDRDRFHRYQLEGHQESASPDMTLGDLLGGFHVKRKDATQRQMGAWFFAAPGITTEASKTVEEDEGATRTKAQSEEPKRLVKLRLVHKHGWTEDERFEEFEAAIKDDLPNMPKGTPVIVMQTTHEKEQQLVGFPVMGNKLIAVHNAGDPELSTVVYDLTDEDEPDPDRKARISTFWRVVKLGGGCSLSSNDALAWNFSPGGQDKFDGRGLVIDLPGKKSRGSSQKPENSAAAQGENEGTQIGKVTLVQDYMKALADRLKAAQNGGAKPPLKSQVRPPKTSQATPGDSPAEPPQTSSAHLVLAAMSARSSGPIEVGDVGDIHQIGVTKDGLPVNAAHLSPAALWKNEIGDGPLDFEAEEWEEPQFGGPFLTPVHLRWDAGSTHDWACGSAPGKWRWAAETFFYIPQTKTNPPPLTSGPPTGVPPTEYPPPSDHPPPPRECQTTTGGSGPGYSDPGGFSTAGGGAFGPLFPVPVEPYGGGGHRAISNVGSPGYAGTYASFGPDLPPIGQPSGPDGGLADPGVGGATGGATDGQGGPDSTDTAGFGEEHVGPLGKGQTDGLDGGVGTGGDGGGSPKDPGRPDQKAGGGGGNNPDGFFPGGGPNLPIPAPAGLGGLQIPLGAGFTVFGGSFSPAVLAGLQSSGVVDGAGRPTRIPPPRVGDGIAARKQRLGGVTSRAPTVASAFRVSGGFEIQPYATATGQEDFTRGGWVQNHIGKTARGLPSASLGAFAVGDGGWGSLVPDEGDEAIDGGMIWLPGNGAQPEVLRSLLDGDYNFVEGAAAPYGPGTMQTTNRMFFPGGLTDLYFAHPDDSRSSHVQGAGGVLQQHTIDGLKWTALNASTGLAAPQVMTFGQAGLDLVADMFVTGAVDITGTLHATGKVTFDDLIDPSGLSLTPQAADPGAGTDYTVWVRTSDKALMFSQAGTDNVVAVGSSPLVSSLFIDGASQSHNTATTTTLQTFTMTAGELGTDNDTIDVECSGEINAQSNTATVDVYFGSTIIGQVSTALGVIVDFTIRCTLTRRSGTTQWCSATEHVGATVQAPRQTSPAETLSGAIVIKAQATVSVPSKVTYVRIDRLSVTKHAAS